MNCAIYAEAHSGLRLNTKLESKLIKTGANSVSLIFEQNKLDSVIRIGGIPTLRFWRDLEKLDCPVLNFSANSFSGLPRIKDEPYKINDLSIIAEQKFNNFSLGLIKEQTVIKGISRLMGKYPNSEQSFVFNLSKHIEAGGQIFLANSLPIREWDSFAKASEGIKVQTLRGANGIDGNISYFLGLTTDSQVNYCVLGDLSAMYDLSAGFLYKKYYRQKKIKIIVINNGGGKIFTSLFKNEAFENNHDIEFSGWAKMFGLDYQLVKDVSEINFTTNNEVMELVPDNNETFKFSEEYNLLIKGAL